MVRDDDDYDFEEASRSASNMLQAKQLITNNVKTKRKEQLHRWESSEMNGEPASRRKKPRVQFQDSDIFLSACMSGDEEEVDDLIGKGADINTSTVDGLTALHQSVIDSKPEMVRFLCEKGADVNAQDNEGWTPLHAAACCGNLAIVKYLCQHGADLAIINSDKELALDLAAEDEACRDFLLAEYRQHGVDADDCRDQELIAMSRDVEQWIKEGRYGDRPHSRTGATAMHVAAAKGYTQLLERLIKAGGTVRAHDKDGWTPLHAAAHWAERDSCKILMEHGASVSDVNFAGQDVLTVADGEVVEYLEDLERAAEKRKSPSVISTSSILQDKNSRVEHVHEDHTFTTEHKRELQHRDQISENETLHAPKVQRLSEKSPSVESQSSQDSRPEEETSLREKREPERVVDSETPSSTSRYSEDASSKLSFDKSSITSTDKTTDSQRSSVASTISSSANSGKTSTSNRSTASSSSLQSGDQHISCTVPMPRSLQQPNSWINRGVQLVTRSASSSSPAGSTSRSSVDSSQTSGSSQVTSAASSASTAAAATSPQQHTLPPTASSSLLNKAQPYQANTVNESEAERRTTARLQRQNRRSTQGVTKEQLEEASRLATEEQARRRGSNYTTASSASVASSGTSQRERVIARLASEERDSTSMSDRESTAERTTAARIGASTRSSQDSERGSPTTSATLTLPSVPSVNSTPSASGLRRKSQGQVLSRSNRRGTGPVLAEDLHAAVTRPPPPPPTEPAPSTTATTTSSRYGNGVAASAVVTNTFTRPMSSFTRPELRISGSAGGTTPSSEKSSSVPPSPSYPPPSAPSSASSIRSAAVAPLNRLPTRTTTQPHYTASTFVQPSYTRPTETNLNYKALYEKEKAESERLRKEVDELRKSQEGTSSVSAFRSISSRFRNGTSSATNSQPITKSASGASFDDIDRRSMERKISDLELQVKSVSQLRMENQRLKEENGALVRVISKMTI